MLARVQFSTMTRIKRRNTYDWRMAMRCRNADGNSNKLVLCTAMRYEQNKVPRLGPSCLPMHVASSHFTIAFSVPGRKCPKPQSRANIKTTQSADFNGTAKRG